jgi:hypothetical protein
VELEPRRCEAIQSKVQTVRHVNLWASGHGLDLGCDNLPDWKQDGAKRFGFGFLSFAVSCTQ